jgi:hypothetical protein
MNQDEKNLEAYIEDVFLDRMKKSFGVDFEKPSQQYKDGFVEYVR